MQKIRDDISQAYYNSYGERAKRRVEQGKMIGLKNGQSEDFKSRGPIAYDHYVRVVPLSLFPKDGKEINDYDFTIITDKYSIDYGGVPLITMKVEISPVRIVLEERYKDLTSAFLNLMAVIGGIYSSVMIFETIFSGFLNRLSRKLD